MKFDDMLDLVLESVEIDDGDLFTEDGAGIGEYHRTLSSIMTNLKNCQKEIKTAKKNKDYATLEKISKEIDGYIQDIDKFAHSLDYNKFVSVDQARSVLKGIATTCSVIIGVIGAYYVFDALKLTQLEMNDVTKETSSLSDVLNSFADNLRGAVSKSNSNKGTKTAVKVAGAAGGVAATLSEADRRKLKGTFDEAMTSLNKVTKKFQKLNKNIQNSLKKAASKGELTKESVKLEIYESERNGEITAEEKELFLSILE